MKTKTLSILTTLAISIMLFATTGFAEIPAPPVNQTIGMPDGIFNNLVEAECRACHELVGGPSNPDRHHLLYGSPIIYGACSVSGNQCLSEADCNLLICDNNGNTCDNDTDCGGGSCVGESCVGETAASDPLASPEAYSCLSCHDEEIIGSNINFLVERDCLQCHLQIPGEGSVHHLTGTAQGTNSPLGDPAWGDCTPCHGTLVDDYGDDHIIRTYSPSEVTPAIKNGLGLPLNSEGNGTGACTFCHSTGTGDFYVPGVDNATGVIVYGNASTHHNSGVTSTRTGGVDPTKCALCHGSVMDVINIRNCEQCHGFESLHNIQVDSNGGGIVAGGEDYGYGHIGVDTPGADSDCWGCHGFSLASTSAPGTGPITPYLNASTKGLLISGTNTSIILTGSSLTNSVGTTKFASTFKLAAKNNSVIELNPVLIYPLFSRIIIPGTLAPGNYLLTAVKSNGKAKSNPLNISIKPPIIIGSQTVESTCGGCTGDLTITGSGFGDAPPAGTEAYINVMQKNVPLNITSWSDTLITATGAVCDGSEITVNTLFGAVTK